MIQPLPSLSIAVLWTKPSTHEPSESIWNIISSAFHLSVGKWQNPSLGILSKRKMYHMGPLEMISIKNTGTKTVLKG